MSKDLETKSLLYRRRILQIIKQAGAGHTGGCLSAIDVLNVLYNRVLGVTPENFSSPTRNRYVQSKGHCVEALYVVLSDLGFFPFEDLESLCQYKSYYVGHPTRKIPGIEQNTGSLGHGLPLCVGMALAARMDKTGARVFTLMGDGEIAEGSNWEAAMAAAHYKLSNLTAIVDCNSLQITGRPSEVMNHEPLDQKFAAFGWAVRKVDGHNLDELVEVLSKPLASDRPGVVLAKTIKGRGVSYMEDVAKWHHGVPSDEEYTKALAEIDAALAKVEETKE